MKKYWHTLKDKIVKLIKTSWNKQGYFHKVIMSILGLILLIMICKMIYSLLLWF
jgi:hypothetical protein